MARVSLINNKGHNFMKNKISLFILVLLLASPAFGETKFVSDFDFSVFYHPSFDLSGEDEIPMRSSIGTRLSVSPIVLKISSLSISLDSSLNLVTKSITYNNIANEAYSSFDVGLGLNYQFTDAFSLKVSGGPGYLMLKNKDQVEAFIIGSLIPSYRPAEISMAKISFTTPINIIYRKEMLTTTFGIGVRVEMDWFDNY